MEKELTYLKAFNEIKSIFGSYYSDEFSRRNYYELFNVVEKTLKEYEEIEKYGFIDDAGFLKDLKENTHDINYLEKKIKALDNLNKYEVDIFYLKLTFNAYEDNVIGCKRYNERGQDKRTAKILPQEQYDLLKEVLE